MNDDNFKKLLSSVAFIVEEIKKYKKNPQKEKKEKIESYLSELQHLSKSVGGKILEEYYLLEEKIFRFFEDLKSYDDLQEALVHFNNELLEL
ncbi:MAG: hypothetical protein AMS24_02745 [Chlamydiae bacterium SM23_39]|nr:MAG: hypothetical protein AMS24_02745 [Chlamydiae bacterium SM23_39]